MIYSAKLCNTVQYSDVQCITLQYSAVQCSESSRCSLVLVSTPAFCSGGAYNPTLHCTALHCTVLYCTVLHCTVMYCTVLHCSVMCCNVLGYTAPYWTARFLLFVLCVVFISASLLCEFSCSPTVLPFSHTAPLLAEHRCETMEIMENNGKQTWPIDIFWNGAKPPFLYLS